MRAILLGAALLVSLVPFAPAQETPAQPASFLAYRPWPAPLPDPLATPLAPPPVDAQRLPATWIDRALRADASPENAPESAPAHYREMLRLVQAHEAQGTSVGLVVDGRAATRALEIRIETLALTPAAPAQIEIGVVVFEHGVDVSGRAEPYVARFALAPQNASVPGNLSLTAVIDPSWNLDHLGVVVVARGPEGAIQSATWTPRQDAPTRQLQKAALVEHVTASWCEPCRPADDAFALLAIQRGGAGDLASSGHASYLRAPTPWLYAGLIVGALAAFALVGRRRA